MLLSRFKTIRPDLHILFIIKAGHIPVTTWWRYMNEVTYMQKRPGIREWTQGDWEQAK